MITSSSNAQVKNIIALNKKAKERREQDVFVAEGWKMFQEAPREWLKKVYVSESGSKMHEMPSDGTEYEVVDDRVFQSMCDTKTPQGVLSVIRMPHYTEEEVMDNGKTPLLMVLEDLQDPGNVGTIIRTAEGAGVTGIIMSRGTADIFNPKTIRSTMGSIYRMPFLIVDDAVGFVKGLKARKKNYSRSCYRWSICNIPQWSNRKLLLILWLWQGKLFADIGIFLTVWQNRSGMKSEMRCRSWTWQD